MAKIPMDPLAALIVVSALAVFAMLGQLKADPPRADSERSSAPGTMSPVAYLPVVLVPLQVTNQSPTAGRLLASNCFQCHGTDGHSSGGIESLAGMSAASIIDEMQSMRAEPVGNNIMKAHARAYTDAEIALLAQYFAQR